MLIPRNAFSLLGITVVAAIAAQASAQRLPLDTRWLESVRENVMRLQERHRDRVDALEDRRTVAPSRAATPQPDAIPSTSEAAKLPDGR